MDLRQTFPLKYYINLGRREDRRREVLNEFLDHGLEDVKRWPAVDGRRVRDWHGYENAGRYALALTDRQILREARRRKAPAVLIFEDDVVLHPEFQLRTDALELPSDWGIFYFGCQHTKQPIPAGPGLVRVTQALDTHALGIRAPYFQRVMSELTGIRGSKPGSMKASDQILARLAEEIPVYAAYPNLAWQRVTKSDLIAKNYSSYCLTGEQRANMRVMEGFPAICLGGRPWVGCEMSGVTEKIYFDSAGKSVPPESRVRREGVPANWHQFLTGKKIAFLFLTRGDLTQPQVWREYFGSAPDHVSIFTHAKHPDELKSGVLENQRVLEPIPTRWGDISLVQASVNLLMAALENSANEWFILLSESCAPIKPLSHLMRELRYEPQARMYWQTLEEIQAATPDKARRIGNLPSVTPAHCRFHSQWWLLNREVAEAVTEDDFCPHFSEVFAPDELYFGTVLRMKGYPLETRMVRKNITRVSWTGRDTPHPEIFDHVDRRLAAEFALSECNFARKFSISCNLTEWGLHVGGVDGAP